MCWMSVIFLLPVYLTYWPRKYTTRHVTLRPCPFDLEQLSYMAGHVTNPATKFENPTTIRSWITTLRVITVPIDHHWKCERGHIACTESRDPWAGVQKQLHFWNPWPRFAYSLCNFGGYTMKIIKVICENNARPWVKNVWVSAHVRNHIKDALNVSVVVLDDVNLP